MRRSGRSWPCGPSSQAADGDGVGFVGLGNMGSVLAANLVASGHEVVTHDVAGPERSPDGATFVSSLDDVARRAEAVVLSLPDGAVSEQVARVLVAATDRRTTFVVDTSTIGVVAARAIDGLLAADSIGYVDAPVSGGVAGARARTLSVMYAGADSACTAVEPVLAGLERPPAPGGGPAGHGAGTQAGQQLPLGHHPGRHQRGRRLRPVGRSRPGHHDRSAGRIERTERGDAATSSPPRC